MLNVGSVKWGQRRHTGNIDLTPCDAEDADFHCHRQEVNGRQIICNVNARVSVSNTRIKQNHGAKKLQL